MWLSVRRINGVNCNLVFSLLTHNIAVVLSLKAFTGSGFRLDGKKKKSNVPSNPVPMGPPVIKR